MTNQLDCYFDDYVVFEKDLVEELADEKHGEEVKEIITTQASYIATVTNLKDLESQANKTIDKLGDIVEDAKTAEEESDQFATKLEEYKNDCGASCNDIEYNSTVVKTANQQLKQAYDKLKNSEVLTVSQLIDTEINKVEVITNFFFILIMPRQCTKSSI